MCINFYKAIMMLPLKLIKLEKRFKGTHLSII